MRVCNTKRQIVLVAILAIAAGMSSGRAAIKIHGHHNIHIAAVNPQAAVNWNVEISAAIGRGRR